MYTDSVFIVTRIYTIYTVVSCFLNPSTIHLEMITFRENKMYFIVLKLRFRHYSILTYSIKSLCDISLLRFSMSISVVSLILLYIFVINWVFFRPSFLVSLCFDLPCLAFVYRFTICLS